MVKTPRLALGFDTVHTSLMNVERTPLFYIANLGAEVSRLFAAKSRDEAAVKASQDRCLRIIEEYTRVQQAPAARQEVAILRDVIDDIASNRKRFDVSQKELEEYFLPFVLRLQM